MLDFAKFQVLTFDCYGLVDWETGILSALGPVLALTATRFPMQKSSNSTANLKRRPRPVSTRSYREVLNCVVRSFGKHLSFTPTLAEAASLAASVPHWRPGPIRSAPSRDWEPAIAWRSSRTSMMICSRKRTLTLQTDFQSVTTARRRGATNGA